MSTSPQPGAKASEPNLSDDLEIRVRSPHLPHQSGDPLQLLRDAIDRLKCLDGDLPDQTQVANLLVEAREALERTKAVARAVAQCEEFLKESRFDQAFEPLDAGLLVYPNDPVLIARRRELEHDKREYEAAAAVRAAIEEANWLVDQDRIDMAVHLLKEKAADLPAQQLLTTRLQELEILLPRWEQKRDVHAALERARMLEESQQWRAALTILEEALRLHPAVEQLIDAAERVRGQLTEHERKKKLARRLELIGQKMAAQSWRQALTLAEETRKEFPDCAELDSFRSEAEAGLRRVERESIAGEVRQLLADGEWQQAEQALNRGLDSLGPDPILEALREELASQRSYREELGRAQVLFAQRRFAEAEEVLTRLAIQDGPEAQSLILAVQKARTAAEEENFYEQGRKKAEELTQQGQFAQAADLLHNLLSLFPGNPILERDLAAARTKLDRASPPVKPAAEQRQDPPPLVDSRPWPEFAPVIVPPPPRSFTISRRLLIGGAGALAVTALVFVSAIGLSGKLSRQPAPDSPAEPVAVLPAETPVAAPGVAGRSPGGLAENSSRQPAIGSTVSSNGAIRRPPPVTPPRQFIPAAAKNPGFRAQDARLPAPPPAEAVISTPSVSVLPAELVPPAEAPAPPPVAPRRLPPPTASPAEQPPVKSSQYLAAQLVERTAPEYPALARQLRVTGMVRLEAWVDERGYVRDIRVLSGQPILAAAAKSAVLKWRYKPATSDGHAISTTVAIEIMFRGGN